jgi:hypothetical protein
MHRHQVAQLCSRLANDLASAKLQGGIAEEVVDGEELGEGAGAGVDPGGRRPSNLTLAEPDLGC